MKQPPGETFELRFDSIKTSIRVTIVPLDLAAHTYRVTDYRRKRDRESSWSKVKENIGMKLTREELISMGASVSVPS